ncbi:hypothetical protein U1Q18_033876 [Sarracenia purpurea var. burkii]
MSLTTLISSSLFSPFKYYASGSTGKMEREKSAVQFSWTNGPKRRSTWMNFEDKKEKKKQRFCTCSRDDEFLELKQAEVEEWPLDKMNTVTRVYEFYGSHNMGIWVLWFAQ